MTHSRLTPHSVVVIGVLALSPNLGWAHGKAQGIVLERHSAMSEIGDSTKIISAMVRGKQTLDRDEMELNAETIAEQAANIPSLFPDTEKSRGGAGNAALPSVWNKRERFEAIALKLARNAAELARMAATATPAALKKQFRVIGSTCKSCHKDFRKKKAKH